MDVNQPLSLLAGLTPANFMQDYWQKKPLIVRQAFKSFKPPINQRALFKLAANEDAESRLIVQKDGTWQMKQGPFSARSLPPLTQPAWSLLVQGVDLHDAAAHQLLQQFRFVPDARLDDLMVSFATAGGGVGPHFDSYDVFLLQASGRRRWKISQQQDLTLQPGMPLKILQNFVGDEEFVLEAGDMLYLPPRYAHDGVAEESLDVHGKPADCMTYSIGFRAPSGRELAAELLHRLADFNEDDEVDTDSPKSDASAKLPCLYEDPEQPATATPAAMPHGLAKFAAAAFAEALADPLALGCALGEYMTGLKPKVYFSAPDVAWDHGLARTELQLSAQTRMMYDEDHIFINGESHLAAGADAKLMQRLANQRMLSVGDLSKASEEAIQLLNEWHEEGWLQMA